MLLICEPRKCCVLCLCGVLALGIALERASIRMFFMQGAAPPDVCVSVPLENAYRHTLTIHHCQQSGQTGSFVLTQTDESAPEMFSSKVPLDPGIGYLPYQVLTECKWHPVYRLRITGDEVFNVHLRQTNGGEGGPVVLRAEYDIMAGGTFHAEILQLYSHFSFCDDPGLNTELMVARHTWHAHSDRVPLCQNEHCPICPPNPPRGRWIVNASSNIQLVQELRTTHVFDEPQSVGIESRAVATLVSKAVRWQPQSRCSVEPTAQAVTRWRSKCNPGSKRRVCFAGDSQMRHIYAMTHAIMTSSEIQTDGTLRDIAPSTWSRYIKVTFGDELESSDLSNCSRLILNIGQWPLGWPAGDKPWTIRRFYDRVDGMLTKIRVENPTLAGKIWWLSTHPHGLSRTMHGRNSTGNKKDWRTDPYIHHQNMVMRSYVSQLDPPLPYIDTFDMLFPLSDLSYDGAHYLGTPGHWAAALVLNEICR
jgi:hypothetical protein